MKSSIVYKNIDYDLNMCARFNIVHSILLSLMNDKIKEYYDKVAKSFTAKYGWNYVDAGLLELFVVFLQKQNAKHIFDIGCGDGKVSYIFAQAGFQVIGLDFSEEMLTIARNGYAHKNVNYVCDDFRGQIINRKEKTAYIFLFSLIHWPHREQREFLENFPKRAESGSLILFAAQLGDGNHRKSPITGENSIDVYCWDEKNLRRFLETIGLKVRFAMKRTPWESELPCEKLFLILEVK